MLTIHRVELRLARLVNEFSAAVLGPRLVGRFWWLFSGRPVVFVTFLRKFRNMIETYGVVARLQRGVVPGRPSFHAGRRFRSFVSDFDLIRDRKLG